MSRCGGPMSTSGTQATPTRRCGSASSSAIARSSMPSWPQRTQACWVGMVSTNCRTRGYFRLQGFRTRPLAWLCATNWPTVLPGVIEKFRRGLLQRFHGQLVPTQEFLSLGAVEDPRGRSHGPHATGTHGACELQAVQLGSVFEQADDVAGVERVPAARSVHEIHGVSTDPETLLIGDRDQAVLSPRDHHTAGAHVMEDPALANRVFLAQDQRGLVGVRNVDIGVRKDGAQGLQIIPRARRGHVQHRLRSGLAGPGETLGKATGVEPGKDEEIAYMQHSGGRIENLVDVRGGES